MIVYVETNFILELAYHQEEHQHCTSILAMAESQEITLVLPGFCLGESYESWTRRLKDRQQLRERFDREMKELARSESYAALHKESQEITRILIRSSEEEKRGLDSTLMRVADIAQIIAVDRSIMSRAIQLQSERGLNPQDAIVYASVLSHMANAGDEAKCFLTKNSKDFSNLDIDPDLRQYNGKLLTRFEHGAGYVGHRPPA